MQTQKTVSTVSVNIMKKKLQNRAMQIWHYQIVQTQMGWTHCGISLEYASIVNIRAFLSTTR